MNDRLWVELDDEQYFLSQKQTLFDKLKCLCNDRQRCDLIKQTNRIAYLIHYETEMKKKGLPIPNYSVYCQYGEIGDGSHRHASFQEFHNHKQRYSYVRKGNTLLF